VTRQHQIDADIYFNILPIGGIRRTSFKDISYDGTCPLIFQFIPVLGNKSID